MIEEIVPDRVVAEEAFSDLPSGPELGLFPEEAALVARAVPERRQEFATVRACARRALGRMGLPPAPLVWARRGAPVWPDGIVGSMTHCKGFRGAAVARSADVASVGIDAEPDQPLPAGVLDAIALRKEAIWLRELTDCHPGVCWDRLLFSAKESVYKTWFPLTRRELDFDEAEIRIDPLTGTFTARLLVPCPTVDGRPVHSFTGRWLARRGLVVTGITLTRVRTGAPSAALAGGVVTA
ncbi:4'-phosphopantetheinyl transferase family protein [Streptomyces odontomachi]|uniref:4'-phosphopantetheinyl transferase family protein n=1 Tax=Streptomyces odontomachi TaxID=2944940 RepID=UPI00210D748C|nr:4'-phosphopantetheinyl transferase superfamily protein [Streptomyces sp. ODS25]